MKLFRNTLLWSLSLIGLFAAVQLSAQDVGNNTLIINSGFTPEIKSTGKINHKPSVPDTSYTAPKFNYSIVSSRVNVPFQPRPVRAAKMGGERLEKVYKGYVMGGMGNYATPMFELLYGMGRSRDQHGGIQLRHISSAGDISDYIFPGYSDNLLRAYYTKLGDRDRFNVDASYQRNMYHYYGVNTNDTLLTAGEDLTDEANEHLFNKAKISLNYGRYDLRQSKMNFNTNLDYYFLMDNYASRENGLLFNGFVDWKMGGFDGLDMEKIGLKSDFNFYNYSDSLKINNAWILDLKPYYTFAYKSLTVSLGFNFNVSSDSITELRLFPDLKAHLDVIPEIMNFEFTMGGGVQRNSFDRMTQENPFVNTIIPLANSINQFRSKFAMYTSLSKYIDLQLGLDYQKWQNGAFFVTDTSINLQNKFTLLYDDYDLIKLNVAASFHMNDKLDIIAEARYFVYNMLTQLHAWHRPDYDLKLQAIYLMGTKFRIYGDLTYTGPMYTPLYPSGILESTQIDPWLDFSLGVEYRYKKRFGFFANFNNIMASNYQRWYNFPSYGFNFMAGASYAF
jgi:hypothetical protein